MRLPELEIGDLVAKVPIVQGGMGVAISLDNLAAAVANEGGIGVISTAGVGMEEPNWETDFPTANIEALRKVIRSAKAKTKGLLGVNIMVALTNFEDMVRVSVEEKIDIIFSGAGLPLNLPELIEKGAKTKLAPIISSGRAAALICKAWWNRYKRLPDAIVLEGPKAGGHLGFNREQLDNIDKFDLISLIKETVQAVLPFEKEHGVKIPVIAGGGIFDGRDIANALEAGASGVQMATRFVATDECDASLAFKETYIKTVSPDDIVLIDSPVGLPGRAIRNEFLDKAKRGETTPIRCTYHCLKTCRPSQSPYCIARALVNARNGNMDEGFVFAGTNAWRIDSITSVKELMNELVAEAEAAYQATA
ncbi:MAG: nitronate monooxygenase family protein [Actinomycetota bacterium]